MPYDPTVPKGDQLRDTFNPILRNLLEADLVVQVDEADGRTWQLVNKAQRRLDELAPGKAPPAEELVYFDHRCWTCGEQRATYFVAQGYLCAPCRREELEAEAAALVAAEAFRPTGAVPGDRHPARRWAHLPWTGRSLRRVADTGEISLYRPPSSDLDAAGSLPTGPSERAS
jgi:hypothetical protein